MVLATRLQTIVCPHVINHGAMAHHEAGSGTRLVGMSRWLNAEQRSRADQLVSIFENGTPLIQYDYAENLDDGRGVTVGQVGFTTALPVWLVPPSRLQTIFSVVVIIMSRARVSRVS